MQLLVLEDDRVTAAVVQRALEQAGYEQVTRLQRAEEALRAVDETPFDVLIVDWLLPGASGIEFVRKVRAHPSYEDVPILMLTVKGERTDVQEALRAGVDDYMRKPEHGWQPHHASQLADRIEALTERTPKG